MRASILIAVLVFVLQACSREETRTVVVSGGEKAASEAGAPAPAASAPAISAPAPQAAPAPAPAPVASAAGAATTGASLPGNEEGAFLLAAKRLVVPVEGVAPSALADTYEQDRGGSPHEAIDIAAARGTRVFAVDDGTVAKLFNSKPGGLTVYHFDPDGNLAYYYAHLDRYAEGLKEGMALRRGDVIGYVGSTGNAAPDSPHLHFAVFRLGPQRQWWKGEPVNPYPALRRAPAN